MIEIPTAENGVEVIRESTTRTRNCQSGADRKNTAIWFGKAFVEKFLKSWNNSGSMFASINAVIEDLASHTLEIAWRVKLIWLA